MEASAGLQIERHSMQMMGIALALAGGLALHVRRFPGFMVLLWVKKKSATRRPQVLVHASIYQGSIFGSQFLTHSHISF